MNQNIEKEIKKATQSEGYLILVTRLNNKQFTHTYFTQTFPKEDMAKVLDEHKKLLQKEMAFKSTKTKEEPKEMPNEVEKKKEKPPEYR